MQYTNVIPELQIPPPESSLLRSSRNDLENLLDRLLTTVLRLKLLILDEIGYIPLERAEATFLFEIVARRYDRRNSIPFRPSGVGHQGGELPGTLVLPALDFLERGRTVSQKGKTSEGRDGDRRQERFKGVQWRCVPSDAAMLEANRWDESSRQRTLGS